VRVACVGDSITFGAGVEDRDKNHYPAVLGGLLGTSFDVRNFGRSGATLSSSGDLPYRDTDEFKAATAFAPDVVVIKLGTNDTKPRFSASAHDIGRGMDRLVHLAQQSGSGVSGQPPRVLVIAPPHILPLQGTPFGAEFAGAETKSLALAREYAQVAAARGVHFLDAAQHITCSPLDAVHWSADAHHTLGTAVAETVRAILNVAAPA